MLDDRRCFQSDAPINPQELRALYALDLNTGRGLRTDRHHIVSNGIVGDRGSDLDTRATAWLRRRCDRDLQLIVIHAQSRYRRAIAPDQIVHTPAAWIGLVPKVVADTHHVAIYRLQSRG